MSDELLTDAAAMSAIVLSTEQVAAKTRTRTRTPTPTLTLILTLTLALTLTLTLTLTRSLPSAVSRRTTWCGT